jgi:Ca2+-binding RTX toxin-like protein
VAVLWLGLVADADARTRCSYTGPPDNLLTVRSDRDALTVITRRGEEIVVREFLSRPQACSGGDPTVLNTDTIEVLISGNDAYADLLLGGGSFAPGATPEAEGASEIEVEFSGASAFATVVGTSRTDEFHWGPGGALAGLNLNPREAGDQDVDVTLAGGFFASLIADGSAGPDTIIPASGTVVRGDVSSEGGRGDDRLVAPNHGGDLEGGPGNDVLTGGRSLDFLDGGAGNDRVVAGGGGDDIDGGPGTDLLLAGRGHDSIDARDSKRDTVKCGPGRDSVKADPRDRLRGCEAVDR